jgi:hypothetical protein
MSLHCRVSLKKGMAPSFRSSLAAHPAPWSSSKFATAVYAGTVCNSSCVTIWLGGYFRHLDPHARLGVHSAALVDDRSKRNELGNQALAEYMRELNVPQQVIGSSQKHGPVA